MTTSTACCSRRFSTRSGARCAIARSISSSQTTSSLTVRKRDEAGGVFDVGVVQALHNAGRSASASLVAFHLVDEVAERYLDLTDGLNAD